MTALPGFDRTTELPDLVSWGEPALDGLPSRRLTIKPVFVSVPATGVQSRDVVVRDPFAKPFGRDHRAAPLRGFSEATTLGHSPFWGSPTGLLQTIPEGNLVH